MAFDHTQAHRAAQMMDKAGGDFLGAIAKAFFKADMSNARKMYEAYQSYFDQYYGLWVQANSHEYKDSAEFTEDLQGLAPSINGIYQLLDSAKFRNWMRQTEFNYGEASDKPLRKYHALRSNLESLVHAAQAFEHAMTELDEPK